MKIQPAIPRESSTSPGLTTLARGSQAGSANTSASHGRRESTVNESGDYLFALREGAIAGPEHIRAEIGEILIGRAKGRTARDEITLFKSLGLAIEDLASVRYLYDTGEGLEVAF